jgi:hypothetical protein
MGCHERVGCLTTHIAWADGGHELARPLSNPMLIDFFITGPSQKNWEIPGTHRPIRNPAWNPLTSSIERFPRIRPGGDPACKIAWNV